MKTNEQETENIINPESGNEENKRNIFNIIIGVSTLLIAILGATFAYFSATATSKENDVNVKSAYVSISYDGGTEIKASNLIPATQTVAITQFKKKVESIGTIDDENLDFIDQDAYTNDIARRCIDAKGREVCYVYQFTIKSDGEEGGTTNINGTIKINQNKFDNLSYLLYEVTFKQQDGKDLVDKYGNKVVDTYAPINIPGVFETNFDRVDTNPDNIDYTELKFSTFEKPTDNRGENDEIISTTYPVACLFGYSDTYETAAKDDTSRCKTYGITNKVSHTYQLLVWLEETGKVQDEQGLEFKGTVSIEVPGGLDTSDYSDGKITGKNQ